MEKTRSKKTIVDKITAVARAAKRTGLRGGCLFLHDVSYEDAAQLWENGFRPVKREDEGGRVYFALNGRIVDVDVHVFTAARPKSEIEIRPCLLAMDDV